jgi:hypothetical protein
MSSLVLTLVFATVAAAADPASLPQAASKSLESAITHAIDRFNAAEEKLRKEPRVETAGPPGDPVMMRATYRRTNGAYKITSIGKGSNPEATVRVRAIEVEKRVSNVNNTDLRADFARAPWRDTPRGWVLDFRFRSNGKDWEQVGDPSEFPTLGVAGE